MRQSTSHLFSLFLLFLISLGDAYKNYESSRSRQAVGYHIENVMKLRCHQCNQPHDCSTGLCYGDICVKSLVNNHYVSKGCENLTISSSVYEPHLKMRTYCKEEEVLGVDTINCYCRDSDFCNSSPYFFNLFSMFAFPLLLRL
ncbi:Protein CBG03158 [Caenorhabditis briggsae]|uniref:Uncharacterized protein n=2 Tax=Caenorhabditis briggsae TaxID=6238 RepID=A0AAE9J7I7_CAEBR|nr:Protein CBG03158 [Caenorhabditis briggsae]ULU05687.1 hypothetical protein L3Y34_017966 [Caenorhabditis briggsae]UMM17641.1 hypothetical protein L5515_014087 [Caenorhabditis briggsae]CAP23493.1 Protein CBG03158 [Caenorhabditis briggsae]